MERTAHIWNNRQGRFATDEQSEALSRGHEAFRPLQARRRRAFSPARTGRDIAPMCGCPEPDALSAPAVAGPAHTRVGHDREVYLGTYTNSAVLHTANVWPFTT